MVPELGAQNTLLLTKGWSCVPWLPKATVTTKVFKYSPNTPKKCLLQCNKKGRLFKIEASFYYPCIPRTYHII